MIAARAISAGSTDDADGTDGVFGPRTYRDHSGPQSAFTRERDLDTERPQERLRSPRAVRKRPRGCWPMRRPSQRHHKHSPRTNAEGLTAPGPQGPIRHDWAECYIVVTSWLNCYIVVTGLSQPSSERRAATAQASSAVECWPLGLVLVVLKVRPKDRF